MNKIKLYGNEYPMRVTMGSMIAFKRETGKDISEIGNDLEMLTIFMFCCVRSACRADGIDFPVDFETFADGMDLTDFNNFQQNMTAGGKSSKKKTEK